MPEPLAISVRVRYVECDMQGHVFNGHYLTWFDMAHTALLDEAAGRPYAELMESGIDVVVAEAGLRYLEPARFDDELQIAIALEPPTNTSLTSRLRVGRGGSTLTTGFLRSQVVGSGVTAHRPGGGGSGLGERGHLGVGVAARVLVEASP